MTSYIFFALDLRTLLPIPAVSDHRDRWHTVFQPEGVGCVLSRPATCQKTGAALVPRDSAATTVARVSRIEADISIPAPIGFIYCKVERVVDETGSTAPLISFWTLLSFAAPQGRASQSSSAKWIKSHTPACCQSRKRRQHVIPDPHPSSCGSICQGMPLRRISKMPMRHARSETRGRPPFGR